MPQATPDRILVRQQGMTLPMTALFIVVLFAFAALAVDVGVLYTARTSAQHAADAAALAGAYTFSTTPAGNQLDIAYNAAVAAAQRNKVMGATLDPASFDKHSADVEGGCPTSTDNNWVCVNVARQRVTVNVARRGGNAPVTYFARVIGWNSADVATMATAEAAKSALGTYCLKPLFMPSSGNWNECSGSIFEPDPNDASVVRLKSSLVASSISLWPKGGANGYADLLPSSNDGLLTVTENQGGYGVRTGLAGMSSCADVRVSCTDNMILNKPGGNNGPVRQGVETLLEAGRGNNVYDTWYSGNSSASCCKYCDHGDCGVLKDTSPSLVTVAVWDCNIDLRSGRTEVPIAGFAKVFIDGPADNGPFDKNSYGIRAHLVSAASCAGAGSTTPGSGPGGVPVRLIQRAD